MSHKLLAAKPHVAATFLLKIFEIHGLAYFTVQPFFIPPFQLWCIIPLWILLINEDLGMTQILKKMCVGLIKIYQWCISPFLPACCRHSPTCSHYAIQALENHGLLKGGWLFLKRFLTCHPFAKPRHEPVVISCPNKKDSDNWDRIDLPHRIMYDKDFLVWCSR